MNFNGLSIDQAPPISAPLRFFLTAPLFGIITGFLILFSDPQSLLNRFSVESVVVTHAITIGFFSFVMLGALTQMLPVLAGVRIPKVKQVVQFAHLFLVVGLTSMLIGLYTDNALFTTIALVGLGSGFFLIIPAIAYGMLGVKNLTATVRGMGVSLFFGLSIVVMGLYLLYSYLSKDFSELQILIANVHSVWAIFGFGGILIIAVSFQVLPMFYVAPKFKRFCKKRVIWLILSGLMLWLMLVMFYDSFSIIAKLWIALFFWAFATTVWKKLNARKRPISDITVWYWRSAGVFLTIGSFIWVFDEYFHSEHIVLTSIFIGGGFLLSIMIGMLYKIVPFLIWFHLNAMGYMSIPTMNEMISKKVSKVQYFLFIASLLGFVVAFFIPSLLSIFAVTFILSMALLEYNLIVAVRIYINTLKTKPDFDMSAFGAQ